MRICPKCGYHDSPIWRPRGNRPYCEYSAVDNVGYSMPELITKIREAEPWPYFDGHFVYHISRTGKNVERIERELYATMKWGQVPTERRGNEPSTFSPWPKKEPQPNQTTITEQFTQNKDRVKE